jgi:hypothetical protein
VSIKRNTHVSPLYRVLRDRERLLQKEAAAHAATFACHRRDRDADENQSDEAIDIVSLKARLNNGSA